MKFDLRIRRHFSHTHQHRSAGVNQNRKAKDVRFLRVLRNTIRSIPEQSSHPCPGTYGKTSTKMVLPLQFVGIYGIPTGGTSSGNIPIGKMRQSIGYDHTFCEQGLTRKNVCSINKPCNWWNSTSLIDRMLASP